MTLPFMSLLALDYGILTIFRLLKLYIGLDARPAYFGFLVASVCCLVASMLFGPPQLMLLENEGIFAEYWQHSGMVF